MPGEIDVLRFNRHDVANERDTVAIEEPLEIRVNAESLAVTMRTPGHDFELAAGLLFAEGLISCKEDLLVVKRDANPENPDRENTVLTAVRPWTDDNARTSASRTLTATSSCGICGKKDIESTRCLAPPISDDEFRIHVNTVYSLNERMKAAQKVFAETGGLHAAALFSGAGELMSLREDIGRHNAVDKLIGAEVLGGRIPLPNRIMMISGRASYEILQKAAVARLPMVCAVSAPSSLAVRIAADLNITLIGFLRGETMNVYSAPNRLIM